METGPLLNRISRALDHLEMETGPLLDRFSRVLDQLEMETSRAIQTVDRMVQRHQMGLALSHANQAFNRLPRQGHHNRPGLLRKTVQQARANQRRKTNQRHNLGQPTQMGVVLDKDSEAEAANHSCGRSASAG